MRNWIKLLIFASMLPWPGYADEYGFDAGRDAFASENYATAVAIWREQASAGDADAQLAMGLVCRRGVGVPKTAAKTVNWLGFAATQGLAHAAYYYEAAVRQRLAVAQLYIAVMYGDSLGVPRNEVQAAAWFRKAADQGHVAT